MPQSLAAVFRALLYWRLLRTNVREAAAVICGQPQPVSTFLEDEQNSEKVRLGNPFPFAVYGG